MTPGPVAGGDSGELSGPPVSAAPRKPYDLNDVADVIARFDELHERQDERLYWRHAYGLGRGGEGCRRLMDTEHDRASVLTENPYWDIVRHLPYLDHHMRPGTATVDADYLGPIDPDVPGRLDLQRWFSWAIPSPADLVFLEVVLKDRPLLDIGAGAGYWAWQLSQRGVDVLAVDPATPDTNTYCTRPQPWHPVQLGDASVAADHPDHVMMLCWPELESTMDLEALRAYRGDLLITVGQSGGCTGSEAGNTHLRENWVPYSASRLHVEYQSYTCTVASWVRASRLYDSQSERRAGQWC